MIKEDTIKQVLAFRDARNWRQYHTGENLSKSICLEAAELLEHFQWTHEGIDIEGIKEELADILMYSILFADQYGLDLDQIILEKLEKNNQKYPVEKCFGKSDKYNKL